MIWLATQLITCVGLILFTNMAQAQGEASTSALMAAGHAGGVIAASESGANRKLVVDKARSLTLIITSTANLLVNLQLPDGTHLSSVERDGRDNARWLTFTGKNSPETLIFPGVGSGFNTILQLNAPPAGIYILELRRSENATVSSPFMVTRIEDSDLRMGLLMPFSDALADTPFVFGVGLYNGAVPVRGARILATVVQTNTDPTAAPRRSAELSLADNGKGVDTTENDGLYTGMLVPKTEGKYWVSVRAQGTSADGLAYERDAGFVLDATKATVQIVRPRPGQSRLDASARKGSQYSIPVTLRGPTGQYEVVVTLSANNGRLARGNALLEIGADGNVRSIVNIDAAALRNLQTPGPYTLTSIEAYEISASDRLLRGRWHGAEKTPAHKFKNIDPP